ncbi:MAG: SAM-dependent methyltransferase [Oscillospiraceae bacterium]|nr:SAM-dependent methyltransferase [Oscillospiraceae bacterium]
MNKSALRHFAAAARTMLIRSVSQRADLYSITPDGETEPDRPLTPAETEQRSQLLSHIRRNGFAQTMEEAAYMWFSRFTALRYMEVNGFLPETVRIFSDENGDFKPGILKEAQDNAAQYRYLLLSQCNALHQYMPELFEPIDGWAELLFPDDLLRADSVVGRMVLEITEEEWRDQVQIIGWLYQYYNAELKDQVYADLRRNIKIPAASIPTATQLFTPDWVVRYLVENSLGRLWAEGHGKPQTADWLYYLDEPHQQADVQEKMEALREEYRSLCPEQIRIIDPCMGSGHILVYAFDVLMDIYLSCGWSEQEAAVSILQKNLFGLDIDRRAYQLAGFALMMKAREYHAEILKIGDLRLNLANFADIADVGEIFPNAESIGSLKELTNEFFEEIEQIADSSGQQKTMLRRIGEMLTQKYSVVITNPPYMGVSGMHTELSAYVREHFPDSKSDLFACFIERCGQLTAPHGFYAMITMHSWMFLYRFVKLRSLLLLHDVVNLVHLGANAFDAGEVGTIVQAAAFVMRKSDISGYQSTYMDLRAYSKTEEKRMAFLSRPLPCYRTKQDFLRIPGHPYVYQASDHTLSLFSGMKLREVANPRQGMTTSDNNRFVRKWYEINYHDICFHAPDMQTAQASGKKWFPYHKGGGYRKWYGNHENVVNYKDNGRELQDFHKALNKSSAGGRLKNREYYFRRSIAWTFIAITPGFRYSPEGFLFDVAGSCIFTDEDSLEYILAFLCSTVSRFFLKLLNPTMNIQANDIRSLPFIYEENAEIARLVRENIELSKKDWDAFETSWEFSQHPLL